MQAIAHGIQRVACPADVHIFQELEVAAAYGAVSHQ